MKVPERPSLFSAGAKALSEWLQARAQSKAAAIQAAPPPVVESRDPTDPTAGVTAASLSARLTAPVSRSESFESPAEPIFSSKAATTVAEPVKAVSAPQVEPESRPIAVTRRPVRSAAARALRQSLAKTGLGQPSKNTDPDADVASDLPPLQLNFRLKTAAIWAGAGFVVIGLAWFIATHVGKPTKESAIAHKTAKAAIDPRTGRNTLIGGRESGAGLTTDPSESLAPPGGPAGVSTQFTTPTGYVDAPLLANGSAQRTVGLNYCIIKSFMPESRDQAIDASHALSQAGIANTIETGSSKLRSESGSWLIIGTRGFGRGYMKSADYSQYMADLAEAVAKAPAKARLRPFQQTFLLRWPE